MRRAGEGAAPQDPPVRESESNGVLESGVKLLKGMVRVYVLDLERKLAVHIPISNAVVTWMVAAAGDIVTKYLRGQDGRAAYERLFGQKGAARGGPGAWRVHAAALAQAGRL